MFPFRIIKCLRTHENLSHSTIHLSIAESIQGFNFGIGSTIGTAHTFTECNLSSLRRNEERFLQWELFSFMELVEKAPKIWSSDCYVEHISKCFSCIYGESLLSLSVHKGMWWYSSGGFQSTLCQVFRELVNCYSSNENKTVKPKEIFFFILLNNLFS